MNRNCPWRKDLTWTMSVNALSSRHLHTLLFQWTHCLQDISIHFYFHNQQSSRTDPCAQWDSLGTQRVGRLLHRGTACFTVLQLHSPAFPIILVTCRTLILSHNGSRWAIGLGVKQGKRSCGCIFLCGYGPVKDPEGWPDNSTKQKGSRPRKSVPFISLLELPYYHIPHDL